MKILYTVLCFYFLFSSGFSKDFSYYQDLPSGLKNHNDSLAYGYNVKISDLKSEALMAFESYFIPSGEGVAAHAAIGWGVKKLVSGSLRGELLLQNKLQPLVRD
jgi:hypothetical protein